MFMHKKQLMDRELELEKREKELAIAAELHNAVIDADEKLAKNKDKALEKVYEQKTKELEATLAADKEKLITAQEARIRDMRTDFANTITELKREHLAAMEELSTKYHDSLEARSRNQLQRMENMTIQHTRELREMVGDTLSTVTKALEKMAASSNKTIVATNSYPNEC